MLRREWMVSECAEFSRFDDVLRVNDGVIGFIASYIKHVERHRISVATCIVGVISRIDLYDERRYADFKFVP